MGTWGTDGEETISPVRGSTPGSELPRDRIIEIISKEHHVNGSEREKYVLSLDSDTQNPEVVTCSRPDEPQSPTWRCRSHLKQKHCLESKRQQPALYGWTSLSKC